ncbi:hypothetical protein [Dechloromonas sp. HYN0024]|uniref:hypothetical protein n=1 Tax=Dechloromonas sp. HYN0024 TaxID=2231055 RepID=UPI001F086726|nr:hypothetical protein [Dechloromonas sp. HYN0024]
MTSTQRTTQGGNNFGDCHIGIGLLKLREALRQIGDEFGSEHGDILAAEIKVDLTPPHRLTEQLEILRRTSSKPSIQAQLMGTKNQLVVPECS